MGWLPLGVEPSEPSETGALLTLNFVTSVTLATVLKYNSEMSQSIEAAELPIVQSD
jgi:hypothetical protein